MKVVLAAVLLASPALAQEDAAHRADRLRTEALNRSVINAGSARARENAREREGYRVARAAYQREMAAWRRRVAVCNSGDYAAC